MFQRSSGILLHPTSFPGPYGAGDIGEAAYRFVDFLVDARQHLWQVLPLGPPGYGGSPYDARSSFAGSSQLIALEPLVEMGLLRPGELEQVMSSDPARAKAILLRRAFDRLDHGSAEVLEDFHRFQDQEGYWLSDYALYRVLSEAARAVPGTRGKMISSSGSRRRWKPRAGTTHPRSGSSHFSSTSFPGSGRV